MTAPRVQGYSADNPFAKKRYSPDNPFAQQADFTGVEGGGSTTAGVKPYRDPLLGETGDAIVHGLAQGLTLGYADEILGNTVGRLAGKSTADFRERGKQLRERSPVTTGAAEVAGALAPVVVSGGIGAAKAPASLLRASGRAALGGAATGAVAGYGYAEGPQSQQLTQTGVSTVLGGALGAATPSVVRGATGLYRALTEPAAAKASRVAGEQAIAALQRDGYTVDEAVRIVRQMSEAGAGSSRALPQPATLPASINTQVHQRLVDAFSQNPSLSETEKIELSRRFAAEEWARANQAVVGSKPAALIDLPSGENVRGAARGVHSQPGPGRQTIQGFTEGRQAGQAARLQRDFTATSGTPAGSPSLEREAVLRARREADAQNFGSSVDAMGDTPITDPALLTLLEDKPSLGAARRVAEAAETERVGKRAMAERRVIPTDEGTTPTTRYRYDSMRRPNGEVRGLDEVRHVTDEGLFAELDDLMNRISDGERRAQYRSTFDDDMQLQRTVATRHGGGPSEQAKAMKQIDNWRNRQDAIETELRRRGHTNESITNKMLALADPEAAAEQAAEREGMQLDAAAPRAEGPTARELQRMKQALDKAIVAGKLENPFAPGAQHSDAQALSQTRAQLVERMNANIPGYAEANASSASALGRAKAITLGARVFGKNPDTVGEAYRALRSDGERQAFRRAYGQRYLEAIGGGRGSSDRAGAVFGTTGTVPGSETKLAQARMAFEDDATFQRFLDALSAEGKITVGNRVTGNSNTASKLADQADLARAPAIKAAVQLGQGNVGNALKALLAGGLEAQSARLSEGARAELANLLTAPPDRLAELLNTASRRGRRSSANGELLARALGALTGRAVSQP